MDYIVNKSKRRADLINNENLAKTCGRLSLYEYRINYEPTMQDVSDETLQHAKATLIEAIFGIIHAKRVKKVGLMY